MIKIIETNYSERSNSFQSRVIQVKSWKEVIDTFENYDSSKEIKNYVDIYNRYEGTMIPRQCKVRNLKYDEDRLYCEVVKSFGDVSKKLIERIE